MIEINNHIAHAEPIPRNPGHFLTLMDVVEAVASPGEDRAKLHAAVRQFAAQGYLYAPARETEGRQAFLYAPTTCLVASCLLRLTEMGIRSAEACRVTASRLYFDAALPSSPGALVIRGYVQGDRDWTLELWTLRHDRGQVVHDARLYKPAVGRGFDLHYDLAEFVPRAVVAIDLADGLDRMRSRGLVN